MSEFGRRNSWIRRFFFSCTILLVAIFLVDLKYMILPINGIALFLYLLLVSLITIWLTFAFLQSLLKNNKPIEYADENKWYYKYFVNLYKNDTITTSGDDSKPINERIEDFAADVEKLYISKWYVHISQDETFRLESRLLIEDVVRRFLQVIVLVDSKKLLHGTLVVFLKHLKEFKRAQKRKQKNGGNIDDFYRFSHVGSKSPKAQEYFIQELTANILRQFITWDLWNSLPCRALVSILSRKLTNYMLIYISKPGFINYKILSSCVSTSRRDSLKLNDYSFVSLSFSEAPHPALPSSVKETNVKAVDNVDAGTPKKLLEKTVTNTMKVEKNADEENQPVDEIDFKGSAVSEPVKIYESKSADKTWRNSSDLECISLGQDPLTLQDSDPDSQIQNFIERKLWKDTVEAVEAEDKKETPQEVVSLMEIPVGQVNTKPSPPGRPTTTNAATLLTNTIKPIGSLTESTLHNMKELQQSTMNNVMKPVSQATTTAMHKIGDLQDEAAGVMEGIFDFGMAGLRKGLRLTGLQDNIGDHKKGNESKKAADNKKSSAKLAKLPHVTSEEVKVAAVVDPDDAVWIKESPNFDGQILLEKTPSSATKLISQELSKIKESASEMMIFDAKHDIPHISTDSTDSPDPEYEETADFATTIAKLRSLLQQKSSESNMTTPALSPMPQDDGLKTTPIDPAVELNEVDGVMPSLYKFCARTATGVFQNTLNTIKTALPSTISDIEVHDNKERWTYVEADVTSDDLFPRMEKLLAERRVYCTVDTAYEAVDSLDLLDNTNDKWTDHTPTFDDELDDFEVQIPVVRVLADIFCELVSDTNASITQEPIIKSLLLLTGTVLERKIETKADKFVRNINKLVGHLPQNYNQSALPMKLEEMVKICVEAVPKRIKQLLSESTIEEAVKLFILSLQSQKVNEDVFMQIFELYASQIIFASSKLTPAFSA